MIPGVQFSREHSIVLEVRQSTDSIPEGLNVEVHGTIADVVESLEQLAWMSASLRRPCLGQTLSMSHVDFRITAAPPEDPFVLSELFLMPLRSQHVPFNEPGTCWTPLFDRSILAWAFPFMSALKELGWSYHLIS